MKDFESKIYLCALNKIFGFEPRLAIKLLETFPNPKDIFLLSEDEKRSIFGPFSKHAQKLNEEILNKCEQELKQLATEGINYLGITDDSYPKLLKECEDAPVGLYLKSNSNPNEIFSNTMNVSIVGTRNLSSYGAEWCEKIVRHLSNSEKPPTIISGLAYGVDIIAHKTALDCNIPTIAVMATGPNEVYPKAHLKIARQISETRNCALITDYSPNVVALPVNFIRRNRIIAGLSQSTILVESAIKGGGMITARLAFSYDRNVLAVPGRNDDKKSQGCNLLIRERVADMLDSLEGLNKILGIDNKVAKNSSLSLSNYYKEKENKDKVETMAQIIQVIRRNRDISIEDISEKLNLEYNNCARLVRMLQKDGFINIDMFQNCSINIKKC